MIFFGVIKAFKSFSTFLSEIGTNSILDQAFEGHLDFWLPLNLGTQSCTNL